jgi:hypothetical protein
VLHKPAEDVDIVLRVPAPRNLFVLCGGQGAADFDALDDIGAVVAEVLESFSERSVVALLLTRADILAIGSDEAVALGPVPDVARHYAWVTWLASSDELSRAATPEVESADFLLCAEAGREALAGLRKAGRRCDGSVPTSVWRAPESPRPVASSELAVGEIPPDAVLETALANCKALALACMNDAAAGATAVHNVFQDP